MAKPSRQSTTPTPRRRLEHRGCRVADQHAENRIRDSTDPRRTWPLRSAHPDRCFRRCPQAFLATIARYEQLHPVGRFAAYERPDILLGSPRQWQLLSPRCLLASYQPTPQALRGLACRPATVYTVEVLNLRTDNRRGRSVDVNNVCPFDCLGASSQRSTSRDVARPDVCQPSRGVQPQRTLWGLCGRRTPKHPALSNYCFLLPASVVAWPAHGCGDYSSAFGVAPALRRGTDTVLPRTVNGSRWLPRGQIACR
jgi:hypothetical protein